MWTWVKGPSRLLALPFLSLILGDGRRPQEDRRAVADLIFTVNPLRVDKPWTGRIKNCIEVSDELFGSLWAWSLWKAAEVLDGECQDFPF